MTESWTAAFKEIHGRTPKKSDFIIAPPHVKQAYFDANPSARPSTVSHSSTKPSSTKSDVVRMKRLSPVKKMSKKRPRAGMSPAVTRSPAKKMLRISSPMKSAFSPLKARSPCKKLQFGLLSSLTKPKSSPRKQLQSPSRALTKPSPLKRIPSGIPSSLLSPMRPSEECASPTKMALRCSPRKNLFATPDKGVWAHASPVSTIREGFSSPLKPQSLRQDILRQRNVDALLAPSPVKPTEEEAGPAFEDESKEIPEEIANQPIKKKKYKSYYKKKDTNFVRLNMQKKSFVKGRLTDQQKKKLIRKAKFNRFRGGFNKWWVATVFRIAAVHF